MFGKRGTSGPGGRVPVAPAESAPAPVAKSAPAAPSAEPRPAPPPVAAPPPPSAAAPAEAPAAPTKKPTAEARPRASVGESGVRRSENFYDIKSTVFSALIDTIDLSQLARLDTESAREEIRDIVNDIIALKNIVMSIAEQEDLLEDICNDVLGLGPLEPLLARDDISDIMVNGAFRTYIEVAGKVQETTVRFRDNAQLMNICQRIVSQVGRRVDEASPICDARLPDGSRVNVIAPPLAIDGPTLTIRKFKRDKLTLDQLVKLGTVTTDGATILQIIARSRCNVLVSGGTGSGKTTLLNCLTRYIDADERIITAEDAAELQLQQPHVVRLETRPPNIEGEGEITMRDLVKNCLRMRPERIIVGEVRGPEAFDLLQAMNTGHDGSMGTLHANSPREAMSRLESMITMGGFALPAKTIREMIANSIDVIIQTERLRDGSRRVTYITEVIGTEGEVITTQDIFVYEIMGEDQNGRIQGRHRSTGIGRPKFWERARYYNEENRLAAALDAANADELKVVEQQAAPVMFGSVAALLSIVTLAALSAGGIAYTLLYGRIQSENTAERRLDFIQGKSRTAPAAAAGGRAVTDPTKRRKSVGDTLKEIEQAQKAKAKESKSPPLATRMQQAGLSWTRRTFWIIGIVAGAVAFIGTWLAGGPLYLAAAFGVVGLLGLPRWYVNRRRNKRIRHFVDEFANAVDVIVRGVKAGLPLNDCIKIIANEAAEPVRGEFRLISETQSLGLTLSDAVARLPDRVPVPEANFFAIVIAIQQRAGGNLAEALGNLSRVLRERKKMKGKIGAMAMEAKASAYIIGALPVVVMVLVWITSPAYISLLFTETLGNVILGASAVWMSMGVLVMRKMINFDF